MKNFIEKNKAVITYIGLIVAVMSVFIIINAAGNCQQKKVENTITQSELQTALNIQKRELDEKYMSQLIDSSKVIKSYHKKISDGLKPRIVYKEKIVKVLVDSVRKDSVSSELCLETVNKQEELIFDLETKAYHDSIQLFECNYQNVLNDSLIYKKDASFDEQIRINSELQKAVKRTFIEKNGIKIGVAGTIISAVCLKLIFTK